MKKPRADAILLNLPEHQQSQLAEWLLAGMTYRQAQTRVKDEFNITVSLGVFSNFYNTICIPILSERRADLAKIAQTLVAQDGSDPKAFDKAIFAQLKQRIFELCLSPETTQDDIQMLFECIQKSRDIDIAEAKLELERRKVEFLEAPEYKRTHPKPRPDYTKPLTPEQRAYMVNFVEKKMGLKAAPYTPEVIKAMPKYYQDLFLNHPNSERYYKKPEDASDGHDPQMMKNDKLSITIAVRPVVRGLQPASAQSLPDAVGLSFAQAPNAR